MTQATTFGRGSGHFYGKEMIGIHREWKPKIEEWYQRSDRGTKSWDLETHYFALGNALALDTGNPSLDDAILQHVRELDRIPQYFQVINKDEGRRFTSQRDEAGEVRLEIQDRMRVGDYLVSQFSGGISMGAKLRPTAPQSPFYHQIKRYNVLIGGNDYKTRW